MARVIGETAVQFPRLAHVVEDEHAAGDRSAAVADGRGGALDVDLIAVAADEQHRADRFDRPRAADGHRERILERLAGFLVESAEDLLDGASLAVLEPPAGEGLGNRIDVVDHALGVGGDDPVADALQRDLGALLLAKQRFLVQLALGDVEFDPDEAQQPALVVDTGLGAADHPAPLTRGVSHAVQAFEQRRLAGDVIADCGLHAGHVVGMHERAPVWCVAHLALVVAEHRFPARRKIDAVVQSVEIPKPVVRAVQGEFVALLQITQLALNGDALERARKAAADELHQQVQLHFPVGARVRPGNSQRAGRPALDEVADHQHRTDAEPGPDGGVGRLILARMFGVAQFRDAQLREPRAKPRQHLQALSTQLFRVAGGKHAAGHGNVGEALAGGIDCDVKGRVGAGRLAQQLEVGREASLDRGRRHGLEIHRDLDAGHVQAHGGARAPPGPRLLCQHVGVRQIGVTGIDGCDCHAPYWTPRGFKPLCLKSLPFLAAAISNASHTSRDQFMSHTFGFSHNVSGKQAKQLY